MNADTRNLAMIFTIASVEELRRFLASCVDGPAGWRWTPLGGRDNNAGSVNLAVDPGQALVERVTNSMDAHIELRYERANRPEGLSSPRAAVWQLWSLEGARLTRQSAAMARFIDEMAAQTTVRVLGSSVKGQSTVVIEDTGIGQHPDDFPRTILSLGESNKVSKPYLIGAFGQGGSSTLAYCPYSVIISRRDAGCLGDQSDLIGWTIVRKYDDDSLKTFRYEYLLDPEGQVPRVTPSQLESLGVTFHSGMKITHLGYELGRLGARWSLVGYRFFDNLLFDPVLPYRIEDRRWTPPFNRNMYGARNRLDQPGNARHPESQTFEADLSQWGGEGTAHIRYWVFQAAASSGDEDVDGVKLDSYLDSSGSPRTIVFTLNGQRHYTQEKRIVREARLAALADYLLMHVDCDDLSRRLKKEIFTANRAGAAAGERREDVLVKAVQAALADPWLRQKMDEIIRRRQSQISDESSRRVSQMLDRLISIYRTERGPGGRRGPSTEGQGGADQRQTRDPPTYLHFADHRRLDISPGELTTLYLLTDAPDDFFTREHRPGQIRIDADVERLISASIGPSQQGRIAVTIRAPSTSPVGQTTRATATLDFPPSTFLTDSREIKIASPPPPYQGVDPPTKFEFSRSSTLKVELGKKSTAEVSTNARNDILTRAYQPAEVRAVSSVSGVYVTIRGPRNGSAHVEVTAAPDAIAGATGPVTAELALADGSVMTTSRQCTLESSHARNEGTGSQRTPIPAYRLERVWREPPSDLPDAPTWNSFATPYTEEKVGHWEMNGEELWLYLNMNERKFEAEQVRWARQFGENYSTRLRDRYIAYLAFHIFQLHDRGRVARQQHNGNGQTDSEESTYDPESELVRNELARVAATLIQTMRSEASLARLDGTVTGFG